MNNYYNNIPGDIVIIKNIIFTNASDSKKSIDHAWKRGRPCLIIYSDEEYDYYLTITSSKEKKSYFKQVEDEYYKLINTDFKYLNINRNNPHKSNSLNNNLIHLKELHRKKISGYVPIGKLRLESYLDVLRKFSKLHNEQIEDIIKKGGNHERK